MTTDSRKYLVITYNALNLQQSLSQNGTTVASYTWLADGTKCGVVDNNNNGYDYTGSLIYSRSGSVRTPESIENGAGRIMYSGGTYNPHYYITDHLGSTRVITDNSGNVVERDDYYPFGGQLPISTYPQLSVNRFKFNGKELQTTGNTGFLDYGARMYDDVIGRWGVVDPMAERRIEWSPYAYCLNNPILRIDPNGLTDFTIDKRTGEVKQVGEKNDDPDRILKTNRKGEIKYNKKGEAKVAVDGIEQGILKDGQNFKNEDQVISVGGDGQPSVEGVKSFTLQLSEYVGREMKGFSYSSNGSGNVTDMLIGKYLNNNFTQSYGGTNKLQNKYGANFSLNNILQQFHTHPNGETGATQYAPELSKDITTLQNDKPFIPNASFIILYRSTGQIKPKEYDYTHNYRPKK
jgi:RHS repeat-associated protein